MLLPFQHDCGLLDDCASGDLDGAHVYGSRFGYVDDGPEFELGCAAEHEHEPDEWWSAWEGGDRRARTDDCDAGVEGVRGRAGLVNVLFGTWVSGVDAIWNDWTGYG